THPVCNYPTGGPLFAPPAIQRAVVTVPGPARGPAGSSKVIAFIHPAAMPKGSVLFIVDTFSVQPNGSHTLSVTSPAVLKSGKLPHCTRAEFPAPARPTPTPVPTGTPSPYPSASPTQSPPFGSPSPTPRPSSPSHSASPSPAPSASPSRTTSPEPTPSHPGS